MKKFKVTVFHRSRAKTNHIISASNEAEVYACEPNIFNKTYELLEVAE